jgi:hypothetical protein
MKSLITTKHTPTNYFVYALLLTLMSTYLALPSVAGTTEQETRSRSTWKPSIFASVSYKSEAQVLTLKFHSGYAYRYYHVPVQLFTQLDRSTSQGRFYNDHIRQKFACERIDKVNPHQAAFNASQAVARSGPHSGSDSSQNSKATPPSPASNPGLVCPYQRSHWTKSN